MSVYFVSFHKLEIADLYIMRSFRQLFLNIGFLHDIINNLYSEFSLAIPKILLYNGIKQFFAANLKYGRWIN